ncbi:substrate-binding domain-containing protein [Danxiaibacter flavus]|uniref:histidine kinase n=1 Tax=Danxiaibacter flavus TaxID=3049108 RepID=A0ABV3ZLE8_9BACT|nr:substrate-binding domain-containing protein [Chitinophagaceae bacterium DXS]
MKVFMSILNLILLQKKIFFTTLGIFILACNSKSDQKKYLVGFSQCTMVNKWRQTMLEGMQRELSFHPEINFIFKDANGSTEKQIEQIQELIDENINLLIVSPNKAEPITPIVEKAFARGIRVIIVDRRTSSDKYTAYVGARNYDVGLSAGAFANSILKGKGNVLEVSDIPGSSADIDRHNGFVDFIKKYPGINYKARIYFPGDENPSGDNLMQFLQTNPDIQLIFCQNDRLALSAYRVSESKGLDKKISIIGVDGLPGINGGIDLVEKGALKATILYPSGGEEAILTAVNILENKTYRKENPLASTVIDSSNVRIVKMQNEKILAQQSDIDRRQKKIQEEEIITQNQSNIIYAISVSLALALIFGSILFYYLLENKKINKRLAIQNEEIINQRNQLIELSKKANEANDAKIKFFTKISHELRTPLTLILGPLEELLQNETVYRNAGRSLLLMHKNTIMLLRLINQLMDFRKIEIDKLKLRFSENDIVLFLNQIIEAYKEFAKKRNIDLRFVTNIPCLNVWFDETMLDKVLFNLLSNAFKFTNDNGYIYVSISKDEEGKNVRITVEDNGVGMSETGIQHAFELFYQGEYENYKGSGLGLALSKELILLHKGTIEVQSEKWKGTKFIITLPLGDSHLEKSEIINKEIANIVLHEDEKIYTSELLPQPTTEETPDTAVPNEYSILIIEDYKDLKNYLKNRLGKYYEILEADNGTDALQQAFDAVPDLIICDVMIPGRDGFELTNVLKSDIRTSHIPVILLTAKTSVEAQIEGMRHLADSYITKPFNQKFLEENIRSLLKNRSILREHYSGEIPSELKIQTLNKIDKKFIAEFNALIESNIANENFSVEEICKHMGLSRMQLYRKVKALLNVNANEYVLNKRMQKAKYLLQQEEFTISEIAYKVGFSSLAYFSTVFKSKFNVTPSEFREKNNVTK